MTEKRAPRVLAVDKDAITYEASVWFGPTEPGEVGHYEHRRVTESHQAAIANTRNASFGSIIAEAIKRRK